MSYVAMGILGFAVGFGGVLLFRMTDHLVGRGED